MTIPTKLIQRLRDWRGDPDEVMAEAADALEQQAAEIAALRADAERYRWLGRKVSAHGINDGWQFGFPTELTLPAPVLAMYDPHAALDAAIDAALRQEQQAKGDGA